MYITQEMRKEIETDVHAYHNTIPVSQIKKMPDEILLAHVHPGDREEYYGRESRKAKEIQRKKLKQLNHES